MRLITQLTNSENRKDPNVRFRSISCVVFGLVLVVASSAYARQSAGVLLQSGLYKEEVSGDLEAAIGIYERILEDFPKDRPVAAKALLHIGLCYEKLGKQEARKAYQRLITEYADQQEVMVQARTRLAALEQPAAPTEPKGMTVRKVWKGLDVDDCGEISPDGKYLSYVDWDTGDLAIYEIATGKKRHITNKGSWEDSDEFAEVCRWSPDGRQIAYAWFNEQEKCELRLIGIDGAPEPRIVFSDENYLWVSPCDWSKNGKRILAWLNKKDGKEIAVISIMDGSVCVLKEFATAHLGRFNNMVFSSEGDAIIYDDVPPDIQSGNHDIFLFSIESGTERVLVKHPSHDYVLGRGPDGEHLLFGSDRTGTSDIWAIKVVDGKAPGAPQLIKSEKGPSPLTGLGSTTEGLFYYCNSPQLTDVYVMEIDPETGEIVVPPREAVNRFVGSNGTPDYSPDGKYMAYVSRRGPFNTRINRPIGNVLCIRSLETGEDREFRPPRLNAFGFPRWSPDGRSVMVVNWEDDNPRWHMGHYVIDTRTGQAKLVVMTQEPQRIHHHAWSADGKSVFLVRSTMPGDNGGSMRSMRMQIVAREIESGEETELLSGTWRDVYSISRSPDGRWLAVLGKGKKRNLRVIPATGGEPRIVHTFEQGDNRTTYHVWSADGRYIFLTKLRQMKGNPKWDIWRIPVEGGKPQNLGLEMNSFWWLSAHPDGRHIAFTNRASDYDLPEVWVMENFLPEETVAHKPTFRKIRIASKPQNGVLSPDGNKLAFMSDDAVWVVPVHGKVDPDIAGEPIRLAEVPELWEASNMMAWSANGEWIAVYGENGVHIIPLAGGEARVVQLPNQGGHLWSYRLSLSPDAQMLAFSALELHKPRQKTSHTHDRYICTIATAGGEPKQVSSGWGRMPSFSPDGKFIAYVGYREREDRSENMENVNSSRFRGDLWIVPSNDGTPVKLASVEGRLRGPVWSPDGKYIAAHHEPGGTNDSKEIWVFPLSSDKSGSGKPIKISLPMSSWNMLAGWTPEGELGVFLSPEEHFAGYTVPASGGRAVQITPESIVPYYPRWSVDGERILLRWVSRVQNPGESVRFGIGYVPAEGGALVELPWPEGPSVSTVPGGGHNLSPNGKRIVISASHDIWTIPLEGGLPTRLTSDDSHEEYPCWSPDGEWVAFVDWHAKSEGEGFKAIYIVPAEGGQVRQVSSESDRVGGGAITFSPDGERIAFFSDGSIKTIPIDGGQLEVLVSEVKSGRHSQLAYCPDGSKIAHSAAGKIWITPLAAGEPEELRTGLPDDARLSEFDWSPDGSKIVFIASIGGEPEFWLIDNFLPESTASD